MSFDITPGVLYYCKSENNEFVMMCLKSGKCVDILYHTPPDYRSPNRPWGPPEEDFLERFNVKIIGAKEEHPEYFL